MEAEEDVGGPIAVTTSGFAVFDLGFPLRTNYDVIVGEGDSEDAAGSLSFDEGQFRQSVWSHHDCLFR